MPIETSFSWELKTGHRITVEAVDVGEDEPIQIGFGFDPVETHSVSEVLAQIDREMDAIEQYAVTKLNEEFYKFKWERSSENRYA